jgi:hypothetical protein
MRSILGTSARLYATEYSTVKLIEHALIGHQNILEQEHSMLKNATVRVIIITALILASIQTPRAQNTAPQLGRNSVKEIVAAMTTEEKARLLVGMGFNIDLPGLPRPEESRNTPEKVAGAAGRTYAIPRLGIPSITLADGPAGVRINPIRNILS